MAKAAEKSQDKPKHTPMMQQFLEVKDRYPDCLLFYRMGDFYELFFDDAVTASAVLDITLTKRGKTDDTDIPMCGVPWHSHESYLAKLIKAGHKVAICEQVETPEEAKARGGYKALVKRDVVRVVTQGTLLEDNMLEARSSNYLACLASIRNGYALAWLELSTGGFYVQSLQDNQIAAKLASLSPSEILISDSLYDAFRHTDWAHSFDHAFTIEPDVRFNSGSAENTLLELYSVKSLDGFGHLDKPSITAAGALIDYTKRTQLGALPHISPLNVQTQSSFMEIDLATRRSLELTQTQKGEKKGSLLHCIDRCITGAGSRLLASWLSQPLLDIQLIKERQDNIGFFLGEASITDDLTAILKETPDLERALSRITIGRCSPRDLDGVKTALTRAMALSSTLDTCSDKKIATQFQNNLTLGSPLSQCLALLEKALIPEPPALARDGGFIAKGYNQELDRLRNIKADSRKTIATLQSKYADIAGVSSLKISYNNVLGYFIEVKSKDGNNLLVQANNDNTPKDNPFVHRQTLANVMRFTTPELSELERDIAQAADKALAIELEIFSQLCHDVSAVADPLLNIARALAEIDVCLGLATLARNNNYTKPEVSDDQNFQITQGRHAVVEQALKTSNEAGFIANDCTLSEESNLWLLTGPNMAGKSTFLRQNALIVILAQIGSYVPAQDAHIGIIDKIFSRVGAADDLTSGRSTFMVEMVETASILNQATDKSFVILDEIGRGTATFDGLSIAWAVTEHLHEGNKCRTIFATHYHELTALETTLPRLSCHAMAVKEWKENIIFLHEVIAGAADRSYGIHVGRLAGLPKAVTKRAESILKVLEKEGQKEALNALPLFEVAEEPAAYDASHPALDMIDALEPDNLSPREALEWLYKLKNTA